MKKIFVFILAAVFLATLPISAQPIKKEFTLEDIWQKGLFSPAYYEAPRSMNDGVHYSKVDRTDAYGTLNKYDYRTGNLVEALIKANNIIPQGETKPIVIEDYQFSADESKLLITTGVDRIYRKSTREYYYVYDFKTNKLAKLSDQGKQAYGKFSPDGSCVAFVRENNLFYVNLNTGRETAVTTDGKYNNIINGAADWVYEEEFSLTRAFEWSPDSKNIAFIRFDESAVKEFSMTKFEGNLYPKPYNYKYPKAGEANSVLSVYNYNLEKASLTALNIGSEKDIYIPRIKWTSGNNVLCITRMNRLQNKLELLLSSVNNNALETKVLYSETHTTYVKLMDDVFFLKDNKHFIITSEIDGFRHFYLFNMEGKIVNRITKGEWDIAAFKGLDEDTRTLYYTAAETSPAEREVFAIKLDGSGKKKLSFEKGSNNIFFSKGFKYYINYYSNSNFPTVVTLYSIDGKRVRVLEDNKKLNDLLLEYKLSKKEFGSFKATTGIEHYYWMIKPPDFDPNKKYPVFVTIYGGPGYNTVNNAWEGNDFFWHQLLAQKGYIVVSVDNRGSGNRGRKFRECTYGQLGKLECEDQIEGAKYFGSLNYVDKTRIGIQGGSFGGFLSSLCITKGADYFKAAIAVSPVTNWRYYDNIYTERYMGLPENNASGYDDNSPVNHVKALKGKYLLIHGTADDNVHFQNSVEMVNALVNNNKQFDMFYYSDKNHHIQRSNARLHLYTLMTNFLLDNL